MKDEGGMLFALLPKHKFSSFRQQQMGKIEGERLVGFLVLFARCLVAILGNSDFGILGHHIVDDR